MTIYYGISRSQLIILLGDICENVFVLKGPSQQVELVTQCEAATSYTTILMHEQHLSINITRISWESVTTRWGNLCSWRSIKSPTQWHYKEVSCSKWTSFRGNTFSRRFMPWCWCQVHTKLLLSIPIDSAGALSKGHGTWWISPKGTWWYCSFTAERLIAIGPCIVALQMRGW